MKEKIKNFFAFIKSAWQASIRGKLGLLLLIISICCFIRLFCGTQNIQGFLVNTWRLNHARKELAIEQKKLNKINHHIDLLQHPNKSDKADYIEELGLKNLNLGDPNFKELKY
ncbi:MAG: hypothetical protein IKZ49_01435 [Alphaproteobacteria bacterium]|nr:hypothetical protein [Alphaproteobacteria bacterium]